MTPLTPKQKKFLDFVIEHMEREGYSPSQTEIARALGFKSLGTVQNYLTRLEREGFIQKDWNARRSIRVQSVSEYSSATAMAITPSCAARGGTRSASARRADTTNARGSAFLFS